MDTLSLPAAFLVGLMSSVHCLGMCGAIAGTLVFSLEREIRTDHRRLLPYLLAYNLGRIASYSIVGAAFGAFGASLAKLIPNGHHLLQVMAAVLMVGTGIYLGGWFPAFAHIEALGIPLWRRIEPYGRHLLPVRSLTQALLFGVIWGWLPCGLVYTGLVWAVAADGAVRGALLMACFGLGTLPAVASVGLVAGWLLECARRPSMKRIVAAIVILLALLILWIPETASHRSHIHPHPMSGT
ncbi:DsbD_2 domain-containing protein [Gammaproteobacteria bacterium]